MNGRGGVRPPATRTAARSKEGETAAGPEVFEVLRWGDWMGQAEEELSAARWLLQGDRHAWCCFTCQQAAEKALKAVLDGHGAHQLSHNLVELLREAEAFVTIPEPTRRACERLNRCYIPTRYPDAHPTGVPARQYQQRHAAAAVSDAQSVIDFARAVRTQADHAPSPVVQPSVSERLDTFMKRLLEAHGEELDFVVFFGSAARGESPESDLDLLLGLLCDGDVPFVDRYTHFSAYAPKVDALPYYPGELVQMRAQLHPTLLEASADGQVLLDYGGWATLSAELRKVLDDGRVERVKGGWRVRDRSLLAVDPLARK